MRSGEWGTEILALCGNYYSSLLEGIMWHLQADVAAVGLASDQALPSLSAFPNDFHSISMTIISILGDSIANRLLIHILLILTLSRERELVLGLAIGDLVDTEPLVARAKNARKVLLDVLNIVEPRCERVIDVDNNDLPVGLPFVKQSHHTQNLDLLDLTSVADSLADLAYIERIVVALCLGLRMDLIGVLPGLSEG